MVELGKIGRPHGVRGEMRLFLHNPSSELVFHLDEFWIAPDEHATPVSYGIRSVKDSAKFFILSLKGVQHRDAAQTLCGHRVYVPRDLLPTLDNGEFYVNDLIGIVVTHNTDGTCLGRIVGSREQGGIEVVTVSDDSREIQIPIVDDFVVDLDVDGKTMTVRDVEDLPVFELKQKV